MSDRKITDILDDPDRLRRARSALAQKLIEKSFSISPEFLLEKWEQGVKDNDGDFKDVDAEAAIDEEVADCFWYLEKDAYYTS